MKVESIKNETIKNQSEQFEIIELKVRGNKDILEQFFSDIQDVFDLAYDEWNDNLAMLTMTFDKKLKEQTISLIKNYTQDYIEKLESCRR